MVTGLDQLLDGIVRVHDSYRRRVDAAVNAFPFSSYRTDTWDSCEHLVESFFGLINALVLDPSFRDNAYMGRSTFRQALEPKYGGNLERAVYERIIYGHEGGLNGFVQEAAEAVVELFAGRDIANQVDGYIGDLWGREMTEVAEEYLTKWGHLLPRDITSKGSGYVAPILGRFLKQHPRLVRRMTGIR